MGFGKLRAKLVPNQKLNEFTLGWLWKHFSQASLYWYWYVSLSFSLFHFQWKIFFFSYFQWKSRMVHLTICFLISESPFLFNFLKVFSFVEEGLHLFKTWTLTPPSFSKNIPSAIFSFSVTETKRGTLKSLPPFFSLSLSLSITSLMWREKAHNFLSPKATNHDSQSVPFFSPQHWMLSCLVFLLLFLYFSFF